jgi:cell division protein FtsL
MLRLNIALTCALLICALALVTSQHQARKKFIDLERAQSQSKQLDTQWEQLQVEQSQLTKSALIDTKARRDLNMQPIDPSRTLHFSLSADAPAITAAKKPDEARK